MMKESTFVNIKVGSGIILMLYAAVHLLNSIVGIYSIEAADAYRVVVMGAIQQPLIGLVVPLALLAHVITTLVAIGRRRSTTGVGWTEKMQVTLGILIPLMLTGHVTGTWYARTFHGFDPSFAVYFLKEDVAMLILLPLMLTFVWTHGVMGFHFMLRLRPGYERWRSLGLSVSILWPALAIFGVIAMYKEGAVLRQDPQWVAAVKAGVGPMPLDVLEPIIIDLAGKATMAFLGIVLFVFILRKVRTVLLKRRLSVAVTYGGGQKVMVAPGTSLLEASRAAGISHAAVCGGRGRCSTCRTRVVVGGDGLTPPEERELKLLQRVAAAPNVRLACQAKASKACKIYPLLQSGKPEDGFERDAHLRGQELDVTVLFADLRGFTKMSENKLPYDLVFVLNEYFRVMGEAIEEHNGYLDKFIGDGIMALFGIKGENSGAREALAAAAAMGCALEDLNRSLEVDLAEPLKLGIGLHSGPAVVGKMGYGAATQVTAIGDTVNQASRLESASKELGCQLVISGATAARSKMELSVYPETEIEIRGVKAPIRVLQVADAASLTIPAY